VLLTRLAAMQFFLSDGCDHHQYFTMLVHVQTTNFIIFVSFLITTIITRHVPVSYVCV